LLGKLSIDPNTSLYATQSLVKQGTTSAIQALVSALKEAEGWAKVDVVEGCIALNQTRFHEVLLASGIDHAPGLESYIAIPLYRAIHLEKYLRQESSGKPRLSQQAALIFAQVLQDSMNPPRTSTDARPIIFDGNLPTQAMSLFESARSTPGWQNTLAVHRLAIFLGKYWGEISRGTIQDPIVIEQTYACLPMMPEIERWMDGPGRDILLKTLTDSTEEGFTSTVKILGELRDPRATSVLLTRIEATKEITGREHAIYVSTICDTLGRLGDRRAVTPLLQLIQRTIPLQKRATQSKRRDNLQINDPEIPNSIVYGAAIRACGQLGDRYALDAVLFATHDFDPYVRTQAIEALKRIESASDDIRSRLAMREALDDPREMVVNAACQTLIQFRDTDSIPLLRRIVDTRPEVAATAYDALRQLG
jgi:HEAT repeat protein